MTSAEKRAYKARFKEFIDAGVDKMLAEIIVKTEIEYGLIEPFDGDVIEVFSFDELI